MFRNLVSGFGLAGLMGFAMVFGATTGANGQEASKQETEVGFVSLV